MSYTALNKSNKSTFDKTLRQKLVKHKLQSLKNKTFQTLKNHYTSVLKRV